MKQVKLNFEISGTVMHETITDEYFSTLTPEFLEYKKEEFKKTLMEFISDELDEHEIIFDTASVEFEFIESEDK